MRAYNTKHILQDNLCSFFFYQVGKKKELFTGFGSVRIVKNCDLGLENAALGLRPRAALSRPRSQFFTIRTSQPANNIYLFLIFAGGFYSDTAAYVAEGCKRCPNGSYVSFHKAPGKSVLGCKACPEGNSSSGKNYICRREIHIEKPFPEVLNTFQDSGQGYPDMN